MKIEIPDSIKVPSWLTVKDVIAYRDGSTFYCIYDGSEKYTHVIYKTTQGYFCFSPQDGPLVSVYFYTQSTFLAMFRFDNYKFYPVKIETLTFK